jgi:hypothetical protein
VCDLPAVIEAGREFAKTRRRDALNFTSNFEDAAGVDLLFTSGTCSMCPKRWPNSWQTSETRSRATFW